MDPFSILGGLVKVAQKVHKMCQDAKHARRSLEVLSRRVKLLEGILATLDGAPRGGDTLVMATAVEAIQQTLDECNTAVKEALKAMCSVKWKFKAGGYKESLGAMAQDISRNTTLINGAMLSYMLSMKNREPVDTPSSSRVPSDAVPSGAAGMAAAFADKVPKEVSCKAEDLEAFWQKHWLASDVIKRNDFFLALHEDFGYAIPEEEAVSEALLMRSDIGMLSCVFASAVQLHDESEADWTTVADDDEMSEDELKEHEEVGKFVMDDARQISGSAQALREANEAHGRLLEEWGSNAAYVTELEENISRAKDRKRNNKPLKDRLRQLKNVYDYLEADPKPVVKEYPELKSAFRRLNKAIDALEDEEPHPLMVSPDEVEAGAITKDEAKRRFDKLEEELDELNDEMEDIDDKIESFQRQKRKREARLNEFQAKAMTSQHALDNMKENWNRAVQRAQEGFKKVEHTAAGQIMGGDLMEKISLIQEMLGHQASDISDLHRGVEVVRAQNRQIDECIEEVRSSVAALE